MEPKSKVRINFGQFGSITDHRVLTIVSVFGRFAGRSDLHRCPAEDRHQPTAALARRCWTL